MKALNNINNNATINLTAETKTAMFKEAQAQGFDASMTSFINLLNAKTAMAKGWVVVEVTEEAELENFRTNAKSFSTTTQRGRVMVVSNSKGLRVKVLANKANAPKAAELAEKLGAKVKGAMLRFGIMSESAINGLVAELNA